jgi:hypothetical protein
MVPVFFLVTLGEEEEHFNPQLAEFAQRNPRATCSCG